MLHVELSNLYFCRVLHIVLHFSGKVVFSNSELTYGLWILITYKKNSFCCHSDSFLLVLYSFLGKYNVMPKCVQSFSPAITILRI